MTRSAEVIDLFSRAPIPTPLGTEINAEASESLAWLKEYIEHPDTTVNDAFSLWASPDCNHPAVRQALVAVLTAPDGKTYYGNLERSGIEGVLDLKSYPEPAMTGHSRLSATLEEEPTLALELTNGAAYWLKSNSLSQNSDSRKGMLLQNYRQMIGKLLPHLDQDTGTKLFELYAEQEPSVLNYAGAVLLFAGFPDYIKLVVVDRVIEADIQERQDQGDEAGKNCDRRLSSLLHEPLIFTLLNHSSAPDAGIPPEGVTRIVEYLENVSSTNQIYAKHRQITTIAQSLRDPDLQYRFLLRHFSLQPDDREDLSFAVVTDDDVGLVRQFLIHHGQDTEISRSLEKAIKAHEAYKLAQVQLEHRKLQLERNLMGGE